MVTDAPRQLFPFISLLLSLCFTQTTLARDVILDDESASYSLVSSDISYYLSPQDIPVEQVLTSWQSYRYQKFDGETFNPTGQGNTSILKIQLQLPKSSTATRWLLRAGRQWPPDAVMLVPITSELNPALIERRTYNGSELYPLELSPGRSYWLIIKHHTGMALPLTLFSETSFLTAWSERLKFYSALLGLVAGLALYNLFIFFRLRQPAYLYYVMYLFSVSLAIIMLEDLWETFNIDRSIIKYVTIDYMPVFAACLFARAFLDTANTMPRMDIAYKTATAISFILVFWTFSYSSLIQNLLVPALAITFMTSAVISYRRGNKAARFFFIGWLLPLFGISEFLLADIGLVPYRAASLQAFYYGIGAEALLFSLALADRIAMLRNANLQLERKNLEVAEESNRLKEEFLTAVGHELRTPLNGITGGLELLPEATTVDDREYPQHLELIAKSSRHITRLVDDILLYTEACAKTIKHIPVTIANAELFETINAQARRRCEDKGLDYLFTNRINAPSITLDAVRLQQILTHLLDNAIRFTEQGSVTLNVSEADRGLIIQVSDTGIGIDPEKKKEIFELFQQQVGGFNRTHGGLGIGLSLAKLLTENMQGQLNVESTPAQGTSVTLFIPAQLSNNIIEQIPLSQAKAKDHNTVLVVEDNTVNQIVLKKMVEKIGFHCEVAINGIEALERMQQTEFDLILMDLQMPEMDGFECTRNIRQTDTNIPIIAVTANVMDADIARCREVGMNGHLPKPINIEVLKTKIESFLKSALLT